MIKFGGLKMDNLTQRDKRRYALALRRIDSGVTGWERLLGVPLG